MTGGRRTAREQFQYWLAYWYSDKPKGILYSAEESAVFEALTKLINEHVSATATELSVPGARA